MYVVMWLTSSPTGSFEDYQVALNLPEPEICSRDKHSSDHNGIFNLERHYLSDLSRGSPFLKSEKNYDEQNDFGNAESKVPSLSSNLSANILLKNLNRRNEFNVLQGKPTSRIHNDISNVGRLLSADPTGTDHENPHMSSTFQPSFDPVRLTIARAFVPLVGKEQFSNRQIINFIPRTGKRDSINSSNFERMKNKFSSKIKPSVKKGFSFMPRMGKRHYIIAPATVKRGITFMPRMGKRNFSFVTSADKRSFSFMPRMGK